MRIHFSNVNFSSRSGPNTFASRLAEAMTNRGHKIVSAEEAYDVFLCFIEPASTPKPHAKFIHRLDGIWFKPEQFVTHNRMIKWAYDRADAVIWQSQFDRNMVEHHWGEKNGLVIGNGIDIKRREPHNVAKELNRSPLIVCSANWHPQKRLHENIKLFKKIKEKHPNAGLVVMGHWDPNTYPVPLEEGVFFTHSLPHEVCLSVFAAADWMIHLAWLDHCPNVVVEALSQGCPVICTNSGGTAEIVKGNGLIIPEKVPYNFELTDYDDPPPLDFGDFTLPERPEVNAEYLDIENVVDKYEWVMRGD